MGRTHAEQARSGRGARADCDTDQQFDLAPLTEVVAVGEPGQRTWRVRHPRPAEAPFEVDATMVDPSASTDALRRWRPDL